MSNTIPLQTFFVEDGLYNPLQVKEFGKDILFKCLFDKIIIDCHCFACDKDSVFTASQENMPQSKIRGNDIPVYKSSQWDFDMERGSIIKMRKFYCSRNRNHTLIYTILVRDGAIQKIGQFPSIKDINVVEIKRFKNLLGKYFTEYATSIGLYSHGVGIGSFVYLRRIIENFIIRPAHEKAKGSGGWNEANYKKKRVKEKIRILKNYLPEYLVNNKEVYSIISKGIHELTEADCVKYYPIIRSILDLVLTEMKEKKEVEKKKKELSNKLSDIRNDLS